MKKFLLPLALIAILGTNNLTMAQISVSPVARLVSASSGTTSFTVSSTVGWSVSDNATWLTATKTSGTNISVSYIANTSTNSRTASITVTGSAYSKTVTIKQEGAEPFLAVAPDRINVAPESGSAVFSVTSNVGWSVTDDASWLTATKTDGSTISVSYSAYNSDNIGRLAHITVTGTGGITETVELYQYGGYISFTGPQQNIGAEAGSQSVEVSTKISEWTVSDNASWVTVSRRTGTNWIDISWEANPSTNPRDVAITVTGTGEVTTSGVLVITQAGAEPFLAVAPDRINVAPESGSAVFSVTSNVGWSVTDDASWLTATKTEGSTISVSYSAYNSDNIGRLAHITVTGTGGITETVELYQYGGYISFTGPQQNIGAGAGSQSVEVSTKISEWTVSDNASWVTVSRRTGTNWIDISWEANPSTNPRDVAITVTGTGEVTTSGVLVITQAGAEASIDVSPSIKEVGPESGSTVFDVTSNVGWSVSDDATWLTATKTNGSTITVSYNSYSSTQNRIANITVTGTGGITKTVTLTQIGAPYLEINPKFYEIDYGEGREFIDINTNVQWTASDDVSWLRTSREGHDLMLSFDNNPIASPRTAHVTISGTGGLTEIITITQLSLVPTLYIDDAEVNVEAESGSMHVYIDTNSSLWTASAAASWLSVTRIGSRLYITYDANPGTMPRSALISIDATGGVTGSFTVIQAGAEPFLDVSPNSRTVPAQTYNTLLIVYTNVEWNVSDDADWLSVSKFGESEISLDMNYNFSILPRTANITVDGTGGLTETVTLTQAGADVYIYFQPESQSVDAAAGNLSFKISSNADWSVTDDASWLTSTKSNFNTVSVSYEANTSNTPRIGHITVEGPGGVTETAVITQSSESITMDVNPKNQSVSPESGTTSFIVNANIDWTVSDNASWLTVTRNDAGEISVSYEANTSLSTRSAQIAVEGTGGITETVTVTQAGETAFLEVSPGSEDVEASSGTKDLNVTSNVEWSVSEEAYWLTASKTDGSSIRVIYEANPSVNPRTAHITLSGGGITETVTFTQAGLVASIEVNPIGKSVDAKSGTVSFKVEANVDWNVSDDASWLNTIKTDAMTISANYEANLGILPRTGNIIIQGPGGVYETVTVTQASETITFDVNPKSREVDAGSGTLIFVVNSNVEWNLSTDVSWINAVIIDDSTFSLSYDVNPALNSRTAYIIVSGTGGITEIISIIQSGEALFLELDPLHISVGSGSDSTTILVTSNITWSASENADWLSTGRSGDTLLVLYFDENSVSESRSALISVNGDGVLTQTITIEQEGAAPTGIEVRGAPLNFTVYPNPAKNVIYIRSDNFVEDETLITLFNGSGKMMYTAGVNSITSNETIEIDIAGFHPGIYILRFSNSGLIKTKKVIIR